VRRMGRTMAFSAKDHACGLSQGTHPKPDRGH
jgi:hypothetical protein